ncbi:glyoxalase/bleomycin resistance/extradiol dioxygenase family protein [Pelagibius sp. Alg239-R121]|uniref:VOC family protein n=1 Tax=Pelagibius sp. Alg239-R121 TaxID=2993448 RepID=UPI0024A6DA04|nr:hypothetical protein [Pelagibius sp. Alg239-R121]
MPEDWMPADAFGRSLTGMGVNLLVPRIEPVLSFTTKVLELETVYSDADFAVLSHGDHSWMLHADHTYHAHPLLALTSDGALRGVGLELRIYGIDPDQAEQRARELGYAVIAESADKPHGLRECYLADPAGYVWVPGLAK